MRNKNYILQFFIVLFISVFLSTNTEAQVPNLAWANNLENGYGKYSNTSTGTTIDNEGNVYKVGLATSAIVYNGQTLFPALGWYSTFIIKIDPAGNVIWAKQIGYNNSSAQVKANGITVDNSGNVCIAGYFQNTIDFDPGSSSNLVTAVGRLDAFVCKLDSSGNFKWVKTWGKTNGTDMSDHVQNGPSGSVYVTGSFKDSLDLNPGTGIDMAYPTIAKETERFVCKLDSAGNYIWGQHFQEGTIFNASKKLSVGLAIDTSGNAYLTGGYSNGLNFPVGSGIPFITSISSYDSYIVKINNSGSLVWAKTIGGNGLDAASNIIADKKNNLYIVGSFGSRANLDPGPSVHSFTATGGSVYYDPFVLKIDTGGNYIWAKTFGSTKHDDGYGIAVDQQGNVYATGKFQDSVNFVSGSTKPQDNISSNGGYDVFIVKFDDSGNYQWSTSMGSIINGPNNGADRGEDILVDPCENVYVSGFFRDTADFDSHAGRTVLDAKDGNIFLLKLEISKSFLTVGSNSPLCAGDSLNLTASGGSKYSWTGPNGFTSNKHNPSIPNTDTSMAGQYIVTAKDSSGCFNNTDTVNVTINISPTAYISSNSPICGNGTLELYSNGGGTYSWTGPNGFSSTNKNPSISNATTSETGDYIVTVTNINGCTDKDTVSVSVGSSSVHITSPVKDTTIYSGGGGQIMLKAQGTPPGGSYLWKPSGDVDCPTCQTTNANPSKTTIYIVKYKDSTGCIGYDSVKVILRNSCKLAVPSAFSPNGDGYNDNINVMGISDCGIISFIFSIYNRYGQIVFQTKHQEDKWNGTMNGKELNPGVFTYYVKAYFEDGTKKELKGNITLIK